MNASLLKELTACLGEKWVLTRPVDLLLYSFDAGLEKAMPSAVLLPGNTEQVGKAIAILTKAKQPYVARGAATSLCGGPVPMSGSVVVSLTRLTKLGKISPQKREVFAEPGVINLRLQQAAAKEGLFYPPDPGSQKACTIGGNVATNAGGPHCLKYGVTSHFVLGIDIILPDGKAARFNVEDPGYDLTGFFVGSEGTLGVVTNVRLKLIPKPVHVRTMLVSFPSIETAIQTVADIIAAGILPATLEAMDKTVITAVEAFMHAGYPVDAEAVLLIEVDGDALSELELQATRIRVIAQKNQSIDFRFAKDEAERNKLWEGRKGAYAAMARLAPNVLVEDGAVPRTKLVEALKKIQEIADEYGLRVAMLFHAGDGNLHPQIIFDERDKEYTKLVKEAGHKMLKACVDVGGTISGEHGIGTDKREAMRWLFSRETLSLFRRLKNLFDPENLCNPDKLIPLISKSNVPVERLADPQASSSPLGLATPATEEEWVEAVRDCIAENKSFGIQGMKTKYRINENTILSTVKLSKIVDFDRANLTLTVQGGAPLAAARAEVEKAGQYLWVAGEGTVGGTVATRASVLPPLRDQILGMRVLLPTGEVVSFGAKTMKNVAGYEVPKLLIGSWGTLGVILDVTFRLFPWAPPKLAAAPVKPFVFKDIHKKIKQAFDPAGLLAPRMVHLTGSEIDAPPPSSEIREEDVLKDVGDKFWI